MHDQFYDTAWGVAQLELRREIRNWIKAAMRRRIGIPWQGGHDEGDYTCSWADYYLLSGDQSVKRFLLGLRDSYIAWSSQNEYHGFRADARDYITHTFENKGRFITSLCKMDPDDLINTALIEDAAHHIGNWVAGVPAWYDWERHMFVSHWLGTKEVRDYPPYDFEHVRHARVGVMAITAYNSSGNPRYLQWCEDWAAMWAETILRCQDRIPMMVYRREMSLDESMAIYGRDYGDPYQGERWVPETMQIVAFLLRVYQLTGNPLLLAAADQAIAIYIGKSDLEQLAGLVMLYQTVTDSNRYRQVLGDWYANEILPVLDQDEPLPSAVIISKDRPRAYATWEEERIRVLSGPSPSVLNLAYQVSGNLQCLERSMRLAARQLHLVAWSTRDGWEHGCDSERYVHGCGNEAARILHSSAGTKEARYFNAQGDLGLPEGVAVLRRHNPGDQSISYWFFNNLETEQRVGIGQLEATTDDVAVDMTGEDLTWVTLQPRKVSVVQVPCPGARR
jgi:hypothetical protein